ncbi:hypothetical protein SDC9_174648 [bioreactor metagenome]|uniref:Uncharacterized protein n=1 Tax=bioreactor metagenome TaxID=1076179 RepID=A0A645GM24_9ZZZZ
MFKPRLAHHPVVQRAVDFELQRAQRVGHALQRVLQRVLEVVHRVDAPFAARAVVVVAQDPVERRVPHQNVRRRHIDLRAEGSGSIREVARFHARKKGQVFFHAAVPPRAVAAGLREGAPVFPHLVLGEIVHIGKALLDELHRQLVAGVKIVRTVGQLVPAVPQPADVLHDGVHILLVLFGGVGVVKAEVALAAVFFGDAEVDE